MNWINYTEGLSALFEQGGLILYAILASSFLLWALLIERYWFHVTQMPVIREHLRQQWKEMPEQISSAVEFRFMESLVGELRAEAKRNMLALQALVVILPLLGLLGTVSGMIKVFEVITVFGAGNTRGMASGISEALVTTMAGLFTALSGLYFVSDLEGRAENVARRFETELVEGE